MWHSTSFVEPFEDLRLCNIKEQINLHHMLSFSPHLTEKSAISFDRTTG
jgi:hypothetical protein